MEYCTSGESDEDVERQSDGSDPDDDGEVKAMTGEVETMTRDGPRMRSTKEP
jgi:hypothetical protein